MDTVVLGRTGLEVSVVGLGCGGHSRLGLSTGGSEDDAVRVVLRALDLGVTFIDTARAYGTEGVVGRALAGRREEVVVSTKASAEDGGGGMLSAAAVRTSLETSLRELGTDYVDVFHLHGLGADQVDHARAELVPAMVEWQTEGLIRFLAVSERFALDSAHRALELTIPDGVWDVCMVGFNPLNPSARLAVLPLTSAHGTGVLVMFAVRRALSRPEVLREIVGKLVGTGEVDAGIFDIDDPLGFLGVPMVEAAYRFARHEPGCHVVLTGTGDVAHLEANVAAINGPPLPADHLAQLEAIFGRVTSVSGN